MTLKHPQLGNIWSKVSASRDKFRAANEIVETFKSGELTEREQRLANALDLMAAALCETTEAVELSLDLLRGDVKGRRGH